MRRALGVAASLVLAAGAVAGELDAFVGDADGSLACWSRQYSEQHLAAHPDQQVTAMSLAVGYEAFDDGNAELPGYYWFNLAAALRDGKSGSAGGTCSAAGDGLEMVCAVDCDGGGIVVMPRNDGAVLADLERYGYIYMVGGCGAEEEGFALESGRDDKQFLLHQADNKSCKAMAGNQF